MIEFERQTILSTDDLQLLESPKRVRVWFGGKCLADSNDAALLREKEKLPVYYFPRQEARMDLLEKADHVSTYERRGQVNYWTTSVGRRSAENAVREYVNPLEGNEPLAD